MAATDVRFTDNFEENLADEIALALEYYGWTRVDIARMLARQLGALASQPSEDILVDLREYHYDSESGDAIYPEICADAADEIVRLRAELAVERRKNETKSNS